MRVIVRRLDEPNIIIDNVNPTDTIEVLKERIQAVAPIIVPQMRLTYLGRELLDEREVRDYRINDGAMINLVVRLGTAMRPHLLEDRRYAVLRRQAIARGEEPPPDPREARVEQEMENLRERVFAPMLGPNWRRIVAEREAQDAANVAAGRRQPVRVLLAGNNLDLGDGAEAAPAAPGHGAALLQALINNHNHGAAAQLLPAPIVPPGLDRIGQVGQVVLYGPPADSKREDTMCSICFGELVEPVKVGIPDVALVENGIARAADAPVECGHKFHIGCLAEWMRHNPAPQCPMCRGNIAYLRPSMVNGAEGTAVTNAGGAVGDAAAAPAPIAAAPVAAAPVAAAPVAAAPVAAAPVVAAAPENDEDLYAGGRRRKRTRHAKRKSRKSKKTRRL